MLSLKTKLIFGSGDIYGGASVNMISFFYLIFLTDVVQIPPAMAGTVILVSKIWDAFSDPLMGILTDRTRTRLGKRRPYFIAACFTVFTATLLLWNPVAFTSLKIRFIYVLLSYLLFNTISTMVMIPYIARQPSLTSNYNERTSLNMVKAIFAFGGTTIGTMLPVLALSYAPDIRMGYRLTALIMGTLFALPWVIISLFIKEEDNRNEPPPPPFQFADFIKPLKIRTFRYMVGIYLCSLLSMDLLTALVAYFIGCVRTAPPPNYLVFALIVGTGGILFFPISMKISQRFGKDKAFILSALLFFAGLGCISLWGDTSLTIGSSLIGLLTVLGVLGLTVFPWTMFPDTADIGKLAWGFSASGSFGGIMTLFRKLSSAFALFLVGLALEAAGYINPEQIHKGNKMTLQRIDQPEMVILIIKLMLALLPLILLTLGIYLAFKYPLKKNVYEKVESYLHYRETEDNENIDPPLSASEVDELKSLLI